MDTAGVLFIVGLCVAFFSGLGGSLLGLAIGAALAGGVLVRWWWLIMTG